MARYGFAAADNGNDRPQYVHRKASVKHRNNRSVRISAVTAYMIIYPAKRSNYKRKQSRQDPYDKLYQLVTLLLSGQDIDIDKKEHQNQYK